MRQTLTELRVVTCDPSLGTIENGYLSIDDAGIVEQVGEMSALPKQEQLSSKPRTGLTVTPGLVNSHMHFHMRRIKGPVGPNSVGPVALDALRSARTALDCLREGVTCARDLGHNDQVRITLRDSVAARLVLGPRVVTAGAAIGMSFGHADFLAKSVKSIDELVHQIREECHEGANLIKIIASNEDLANPLGPELAIPWFSRDAIRAAVETAHSCGVPITAHANGTRTIADCLDAGVDGIEHGIYLNHDLADQMADQGTFLTPTLSGYMENSRTEWGRAWQPRYAELWNVHRDDIHFAVESGVKIATGTDTLGVMATEVELLREFGGMSAQLALESATIMGAKVCGLDAELGSITPGKRADLALFERNPLEDARHLASLSEVFLGGVAYTSGELGRFVPKSPAFADAAPRAT